MGSGTSLVIVGPAKVKSCNSILFTEGIHEVEIKSIWLTKLTHFLYTKRHSVAQPITVW